MSGSNGNTILKYGGCSTMYNNINKLLKCGGCSIMYNKINNVLLVRHIKNGSAVEIVLCQIIGNKLDNYSRLNLLSLTRWGI